MLPIMTQGCMYAGKELFTFCKIIGISDSTSFVNECNEFVNVHDYRTYVCDPDDWMVYHKSFST
jgi:hypothetical protein